MKMAKANEKDLRAAVDVAHIIEAIGQWQMPQCLSESDDGDDLERFDIDNHDHCRKVLEKLIDIERSASLFRASFGMVVLLDPANEIVDPTAGTLELHPKIVKALDMHEPMLNALNLCVAALSIAERAAGMKFSALPIAQEAIAKATAGNAEGESHESA